ncbi:MAG: alpha-E domain-containing protein [Fimbriimonadaceae bacterium]|nr:alpha-E domain-containing protein [Fimbriimonadaceae bacterium]
MMLTRVAGCLYWLGRYLERAENVVRLALVATELALELEGLDDEMVQQEWDTVQAALPGSKPSPEMVRADIVQRLQLWVLDDLNPMSVAYSTAAARENSRTVGEALTREVVLSLNEVHSQINAMSRRPATDANRALAQATAIHQSLMTTLGAVENTLSRDEGWNHLKTGEAMERTQRALFILRAKLEGLHLRDRDRDAAIALAGWRSLLKSVASLENFRQKFGARLEPKRIVSFLIFDSQAPRSVHTGVRRMSNYLNNMPGRGPGLASARRSAGRLAARLDFDEDAIMDQPSLIPFLEECLLQLTDIHESMGRPNRE